MKIEDIDGRTCRLINEDPELKLYVRKNGLVRHIKHDIDCGPVWHEVVWTPFSRNAEVFSHEEAAIAIEETEFVSKESIHI
jgi:hypothetical protein